MKAGGTAGVSGGNEGVSGGRRLDYASMTDDLQVKLLPLQADLANLAEFQRTDRTGYKHARKTRPEDGSIALQQRLWRALGRVFRVFRHGR